MLRKPYRYLGAALLLPLVALGVWAGSRTDTADAQSAADPTTPGKGLLKKRREADKSLRRPFNKYTFPDQIVVKFVEGSRVRLRGGKLAPDPTQASKDADRLTRRGLDRDSVAALIRPVSALLNDPAISVAPLFTLPEDVLENHKLEGEALSGEEGADLSLYYNVRVPVERAQALLDALNASDAIEIAYPAFAPVAPPATDLPPATPSLVGRQGYLEPAPNGIDARYAWTRAGGTGANVRIIDVEFGWNTQHEDLGAGGTNTPAVSLRASNCNPPCTAVAGGFACTGNPDHGTAVLGVLRAQNNAFGITGIAHGATYGTSGVYEVTSAPCANPSIAAAITAAAAAPSTQVGDVIVIEQQVDGSSVTCPQAAPPPCGWATPPGPGKPATCRDQYAMLPAEWDPGVWTAIRMASNAGRIIIEAAGNGEQNLDLSFWGDYWDPVTNNSGAIMVGAGQSITHEAMCFSNFGARVDVQGWGEMVTTLGYGTLQYNGADQNQWYRDTFGGTSSASPIVAGAAAILQGIRKAASQPVFTPSQMKTFLQLRATPQPAPGTPRVGALPNLRAIIAPTQPSPSGTPAAIRQSTNVTSTVALGGDGGLYVRWVGTNGVWQGPTAIGSPGFAPPGAGVAMGQRTTNQAYAFVVAYDGKLYVTQETNDGAWSAPVAITGANFATPGAQIATGKSTSTRIDVFVVGTDGALKTLYNSGSGWSTPTNITSPGTVDIFASLSTAMVSWNLNVFYVANDGALKLNWLNGSTWSAPVNVSAANYASPGAPVGTGFVWGISSVFVVNWNGAIAQFQDGGVFWSGPALLTANNTVPSRGTITTAQYAGNDRIELFYVNNSGSLQNQTSNGFGWTTTSLSTASTAVPGSKTAAATQGSNQLNVYAAMHNGYARASTTNGTSWSGLTLLP